MNAHISLIVFVYHDDITLLSAHIIYRLILKCHLCFTTYSGNQWFIEITKILLHVFLRSLNVTNTFSFVRLGIISSCFLSFPVVSKLFCCLVDSLPVYLFVSDCFQIYFLPFISFSFLDTYLYFLCYCGLIWKYISSFLSVSGLSSIIKY